MRGPDRTPRELDSKLRDELLDGEIFHSLVEAKIVIESWRRHYNARRPHSALGDRPPAPQVLQWSASLRGHFASNPEHSTRLCWQMAEP